MKILLFISLVLLNFVSLEHIPDAVYDGNQLNYSILFNLTDYLYTVSENNSEVENKTIYSSQNDILDKRGGIVKGSIFEILAKKYNLINNFILFNTYDEAQNLLNNNSIDYFACYKEIVGEMIQMNSENLTYINLTSDKFKDYDFGCVITKKKQWLIEGIKDVFATTGIFINFYQNNWLGVDETVKLINKTLINPNPELEFTYLSNFNTSPYAYTNKNNEDIGLITQLLYEYARYYDKGITLKKTNTDEDLIPSVINSTVDMSVGSIILADVNTEVAEFVKSPINATPITVIRYDNAEASLVLELQNSVKEFDGVNIGVLNGHEGLINNIFPNTKQNQIYKFDQANEMFNNLLSENIDAILADELLVEFYEKLSSRISSYKEQICNVSYGISFTDESIRDDFNDFLDENYDENSLKNLLEEWRNADENKQLDYSLPSVGKGELVTYFPYIRPMCYHENIQSKGFELDLLYKFARAKNYTIRHILWLRKTPDENANVNIGYQIITEKENLYFSKPIYNGTSILAVRPDSIRNTLPITVLDGNYQQKNNNNYETKVEINGTIKNKICTLPDTFYNDTILINCSISDISEDELKNIKNLKIVNSSDRIKILYATFRIDNIENANVLFPDKNFSTQSNMDNIINPNDQGDTSTDTSIDNTKYIKKSDKGLLTGGIIAIVIPTVILVVGIAILAFTLKSSKSPTINPENSDNTLYNSNTKKN